jgi:hypothetical protein
MVTLNMECRRLKVKKGLEMKIKPYQVILHLGPMMTTRIQRIQTTISGRLKNTAKIIDLLSCSAIGDIVSLSLSLLSLPDLF